MENQMKIFENEQFGQVRTTIINGEPWFVAADVCKALDISNSRDALTRLDDDEKGVASTDTLGGKQDMTIVNEPGLYSLVLGSRKPEAKRFKRWITHDVIPAIRQTGAYMTPATIETLLTDPALIIGLATQLQDLQAKNKTLALENNQKQQIIAEMQPKVTYYDEVLKSKNAVPILVIAKDYGMSAQRMNKLLNELHVQYKQGDCWLLYQELAQNGYTKSETYIDCAGYSHMNTNWTQKGRLFLYDLLKNERNILPLVECPDVA